MKTSAAPLLTHHAGCLPRSVRVIDLIFTRKWGDRISSREVIDPVLNFGAGRHAWKAAA